MLGYGLSTLSAKLFGVIMECRINHINGGCKNNNNRQKIGIFTQIINLCNNSAQARAFFAP